MTKSAIDFYRQDLSVRVISELAKMKKLSMREATDVYYRSRLSGQIATGLYGIDNLDYKYLANDLIENEPELFGCATTVRAKAVPGSYQAVAR